MSTPSRDVHLGVRSQTQKSDSASHVWDTCSVCTPGASVQGGLNPKAGLMEVKRTNARR